MAVNLKINEELKENKTENLKLHYLPIKIENNESGGANVDEYFNQYQTKENGILINTFRGRPLKGCELALPQGHKGYVFHDQSKLSTEGDTKTFNAIGSFNSFTYWNYDKIPSKNDAIQKTFSWAEMAEEWTECTTQEDLDNLIAETKEQEKRIAEKLKNRNNTMFSNDVPDGQDS